MDSVVEKKSASVDSKYYTSESVGLQFRRFLLNIIYPDESQHVTICFINSHFQENLFNICISATSYYQNRTSKSKINWLNLGFFRRQSLSEELPSHLAEASYTICNLVVDLSRRRSRKWWTAFGKGSSGSLDAIGKANLRLGAWIYSTDGYLVDGHVTLSMPFSNFKTPINSS